MSIAKRLVAMLEKRMPEHGPMVVVQDLEELVTELGGDCETLRKLGLASSDAALVYFIALVADKLPKT